jgi:hypothetical protein
VETGEPNPYLPPEADLTASAGAEAIPGQWTPVPFEDEVTYPTFGSRIWETLKLGYTDPFGLADRVSSREPILPAWIFHLMFQFPFSILGLAVSTAFQGLVSRLTGTPVQSNAALQVAGTLAGPLVGIFISSIFLHPFLWMFGGTRQGLGLRQTIRFTGYAGALLAPFAWIPVLGGLASLVWIVLFGIGLARVHRTDTWRGVCAVLVPIVVGCCLGIVVAAVVMGRGLSGRGF